MRRSLIVLGALAVAACVPLRPATPALLRNATAKGGSWLGGCPPANDSERVLAEGIARGQEALSPEVSQRLDAQFPPGSSSAKLWAFLKAQGFKETPPCANEKSIRHAVFTQEGGSFFGPYPAWSQIAWKEDENGRVVWTKATLAYTGP